MCTDGLTHAITESCIQDVLAAGHSSKTACEKLVRSAVGAGGKDNITVLIAAVA